MISRSRRLMVPFFQKRRSGEIFWPSVIAAWLFLVLAGCSVGPNYVKPGMTVPGGYKEIDGWKVAQPQDAMLHGKWWEIYNEPELNALEEKLNIDNQNIRQSFENFIASRTLVAQARSQLFPSVSF